MSSKIELIGRPAVVEPFYGLRQITRRWKVKGAGSTIAAIEDEVFLPYATADVEYPLALLTAQKIEPISNDHSAESVELVRVYTEFQDDTLVNVGTDNLTKLEDGRTVLTKTFVCLADDAEALAPAIGAVDDGRAVSKVEIQKDGVGARVVVTYISAGQLSVSVQENHNGKLIFITQRWFNEIPPTPAGYTLVDHATDNNAGIPTYTYRWAKGDGEISRTTITRNNGKLALVSVRHLTGPEVTTNPIELPDVGYLLTETGMTEADGHRVWTASYAFGSGRIGISTEWRHNGALVIRKVRWLNADDGDTPPGILIEEGLEEGDGYEAGYEVYAEGDGEISRSSDSRHNGLLTVVSVRHITPPDVATNPIASPGAGYALTDSGMSEESGYRLWTAQYANGTGEISRSTDLRNNGALTVVSVRHLTPVSVGTLPIAAPSGLYALVSSGMTEDSGHRVWTAQYAAGNGEISRSTEERNNGKLILVSIRYLSVPSLPTNPITAPGGTYVLVESGVQEADGHRVWSAQYAQGSGRISTRIERKYIDRLILTTVRYLGTDDGTLPDGFVVEESVEEGNGYEIHSKTYADGDGEISRDEEERNNGKLVITRIRHITPDDVTTSPITAPGSSVLTDTAVQEADGYRIWTETFAEGEGRISYKEDVRHNGALTVRTVRYMGTDDGTLPDGVLIDTSTEEATGYQVIVKTYAEGAGTISTKIDTRNNGQLLIQTIRRLGSAPATPSGYILVSTSVEEADGYAVYNYQFAKGNGIISQTTTRSHNNKLLTYRIVKLSPAGSGVPPTTPVGTIGGIVTLVDSEQREEDGHILYSYRWVEGKGRISENIRSREDGLRTQTYVSLGTKETPTGVVVQDEIDQIDGCPRYTVTAMQNDSGGAPTVGNFSFERYVGFVYPGRAKAYSREVSGSGRQLAGVFLSPPIETEVKATVTVNYTSTNTLSVSNKWQPKEWATVIAQFIGNGGKPIDRVQGLRGYRSVSATPVSIEAPSFPNPDNPGGTIFGDNVFGGTTGTITVTGGPPDPGGQTYTLEARIEPAFVSVTGTIYYRRVLITATIPTQPALPI